VGAVANKWKVKKHFEVHITDSSLDFQRKHSQIEAEAALDGIYILCTSVPPSELQTSDVVRSCKQVKRGRARLSPAQGTRAQDPPDPPPPRAAVRAHVFLCTLAYYLTWHLREACAPLIFKDEQPPTDADPVAKAKRSPAAERKAQTKRTTSGTQTHRYRSPIAQLATLTRNTIRLPGTTATFEKLAEPTATQAQALELAATAPVIE
jgi:hypothetical protein